MISFVSSCMTLDNKKRPNVNECLAKVTPVLVMQMDTLKKEHVEL